MSNLYYTSPTDVEAGAKVRSIDINSIDAATDAAFDKLPTETNIKQGKVNYAVDTGAADAYVVSLPHAPASYADGLLVSFRPTNTNTGASTINVNGLGVKSIRNTAGSALSAGDITSGSPIDIRYSTATGFFHLAPNSTNSATAAAASATAAAASASSASSSASSSSASATTASNYATKTDGFASGSDNSAKSWAVGGTGSGQPSAGDAKSWATKTTGQVAASDYSAKEWAIGTQIRGVASAGSAKDWATYTSGTVDGTEYSAKYYSQQASATVASLAASTGSSLVGHIASGSGAVATTVQAKLRRYVEVEDNGAVGDGVTSSNTAFSNAYTEATAASTIHVGQGNFNTGSITGAKAVLWQCDGSMNAAGNAPIDLPGVVETFFQRRKLIKQSQGTSDDYAVLQVQRTASYTGGTAGNVNAGFRSDVTVGAGVANFEWALVGTVQNSATGGENVGVYGQGWKMTSTAGPTWGGTFEGRDTSGASNPTTGLVGAEVDIFANGTDSSARRVAVDVVIGKHNSGGSQCEAGYGVRVGPQDGDYSVGRVKRAFVVAIDTECAYDAKDATYLAGGVAFRMAIDHKFSLVATNNRTFGYTSSGWQYFVDGSAKWTVADDGIMKLTNDIWINGTKVITSRRTGFTNQMSGTADSTNAYDTDTITLVQLARRVKALQDALTTHGLIGP
jgi:hypothetical protein